jgi:flagellar protein FliO/FliZ
VAELAVRTVFSLAVVVGLLLVLARVAGRRYRGGSSALRVVQRQSLSRGSAVTIVEVGGRTLVLGVTEQQVQVLAELAPGELEQAAGDGSDEQAPRADKGSARPVHRLAAVTSTPAEDRAFADHLLLEMDQPDAELPAGPPATHRTGGRHAARPRAHRDTERAGRPGAPASGALTGSLLSPQTWRQGWQAVGRRAS